MKALERKMGIEPTTFSLARRRSTTEPLPLACHMGAPRGGLWGRAEGQNRTGDTSVFSAVLYRLSYLGTSCMLLLRVCGCQAGCAGLRGLCKVTRRTVATSVDSAQALSLLRGLGLSGGRRRRIVALRRCEPFPRSVVEDSSGRQYGVLLDAVRKGPAGSKEPLLNLPPKGAEVGGDLTSKR